MRKLFIVLGLCLCTAAVHAQKTRFSERSPTPKTPVAYPLKVHISGIHARPICGGAGCGGAVFADAVLNGKKVDLQGSYLELPTGDYQARLRKPSPDANLTQLGQKYELLLPDGSTWRCSIAGYSE